MTKEIKFKAMKKVKTPTKVVFETKDGKKIKFKATEIKRKKETVKFKAKI